VWLHFDKVKNDDGQDEAKCCHCGALVKRQDSNTSKMWDHLIDKADKGGHGLSKSVIEKLRGTPPGAAAVRPKEDFFKAVSKIQIAEEQLHDACVDLVTGANLPVSFFESASVMSFFRIIAPGIEFPKRNKMRNLIMMRYQSGKAGAPSCLFPFHPFLPAPSLPASSFSRRSHFVIL
jgi:hypothetical protein